VRRQAVAPGQSPALSGPFRLDFGCSMPSGPKSGRSVKGAHGRLVLANLVAAALDPKRRCLAGLQGCLEIGSGGIDPDPEAAATPRNAKPQALPTRGQFGIESDLVALQ
jgi:hypothetical protein